MRYLAAVTLLIVAASHSDVRAAGAPQPDTCRQPPIVVSAAAPVFPDVAKRARMFGTVDISVKVTDDGTVAAAEVLGSNPNPMFGNPALAAAKKWRFKRTDNCGLRTVSLTFEFKQPVPPGWGEATIFTPPYRVEIVVEEVHMVLDSTKAP